MLCAGVIGALLFTLTLGACAGQPATTTYQCVNTNGGCYHYVLLSQANGDFSFPQSLSGLQASVDVVPLTCDSACQTSSGKPNAPGGIMNFITLFNTSETSFIRVGYLTLNGKDVYFYDSSLPGQTYSFHVVTNTEIGPGYPGTYTNTGMEITANMNNGQISGWSVFFAVQGPADIAGSYPFTVTQPGFDPTSFVATQVEIGQNLFGHSGATANFAGFAGLDLDSTDCTSGGCTAGPLIHDGQVTQSPMANVPPPYANWLVKPSTATAQGYPYGDFFYTECCQPIDAEIGK